MTSSVGNRNLDFLAFFMVLDGSGAVSQRASGLQALCAALLRPQMEFPVGTDALGARGLFNAAAPGTGSAGRPFNMSAIEWKRAGEGADITDVERDAVA
jgi:hypothetical protein